VLCTVILRVELQQSIDVRALAVIHEAVAATESLSGDEAGALPRSVVVAAHAGISSVAEAGAGSAPSWPLACASAGPWRRRGWSSSDQPIRCLAHQARVEHGGIGAASKTATGARRRRSIEGVATTGPLAPRLATNHAIVSRATKVWAITVRIELVKRALPLFHGEHHRQAKGPSSHGHGVSN